MSMQVGVLARLELLEEFELRRQALRHGLLRLLGRDNKRFFGVALMVLGIALTTTPAGIITLPPSIVMVLAVGLLGLFMVFTIVLLPVGLILL